VSAPVAGSAQRILTVTPNPAIDLCTTLERVEPDTKLRCSEPLREGGGGGVNIAEVLRRLGVAATAVWTKGGPLGELLGRLLDAQSVPHVPVPIAGDTREDITIVQLTDGCQFRFGMPGPALSAEETARLLDAVRAFEPAPSWVVGSGSLGPGTPPDLYARLAEVAAERGARFVLDTSGEPLRIALESGGVWLVKPDRRELAQLTGMDAADVASAEKAAREIVGRGWAEVVTASLGPDGVVLATRDGSEHVPAPRVPIVSRVGAGDSFVAGLLAGLDAGESLLDAVHRGVAVAAVAVSTVGKGPALP
jgi:6-phosphofructokinase 2